MRLRLVSLRWGIFGPGLVGCESKLDLMGKNAGKITYARGGVFWCA
jgi:hypothetical protein